jgi:hypothetical protein
MLGICVYNYNCFVFVYCLDSYDYKYTTTSLSSSSYYIVWTLVQRGSCLGAISMPFVCAIHTNLPTYLQSIVLSVPSGPSVFH